MLEAITEAIQAESAAILLTTEAGIDPNLVFHRNASGAGTVPAKIPSTLVKRVLEEKVSILSNDVQSKTPEDFGKSIIALNVQAVLCVPLVFDDRVTGVIYASASDRPCSFDEHHLQILTGIAGLAAGPLQTALKLQDLQNRNKALEARINGDNSIVGESGAVQTLQTADYEGCSHKLDGPDHRRKWNGQRTGRTCDSSKQSAFRASIHRDQLCGAYGNAA